MKFLFDFKVIVHQIARLPVVFQILFHHLICYISSTPGTISDCPKVAAPISPLQLWKLFLKPSRASSFQALHKITDRFRWRILHVDMHMVFADNSLQDLNIFRLTYLTYKIPTSMLYVPFKNTISIFCNPNYMHRQPRNCMALLSQTFSHLTKYL